MNGPIRVLLSRAPALIPGMLDAFHRAARPLILVPESFTLTAEQAISKASPARGFIGRQVFSATSLIREIRERAGFPEKTVITADGRHMILSLLLLKNRGNLLFYKENVNQIHLAEKLAAQLDDLADAGFTAESLEQASRALSRSTVYKCHDIALIWQAYEAFLASGYADRDTEWAIALDRLEASGLFQGMDLLIYGFDRITMNLTRLITTACPLVNSITVGLICDPDGQDSYLFEVAANSARRFQLRLREGAPHLPVTIAKAPDLGPEADEGIRYLERSLFALGGGDPAVPPLTHAEVYYAANTTVECLHTAQTLLHWHKQGIPWHDMAVAVCDDSALPAMLPLVLTSAGVPFARRGGTSMLLSEYARFFLATLRALRTGYRQEEMMKLIKSGFSPLSEEERMDLENYARLHGVDRAKWLKPFRPKDDEDAATLRLEELRAQIMDPLAALRASLSARACTGRQAAEAIFNYMVSAGAYDALLRREQELIDAGMHAAADRNRQVWSAVNELLDQLARFAAEDHLSLEELCLMLESAISSRQIKSLPQLADSVLISSPNMFFSPGIRAVAVVGLQDAPSEPPASLLTPAECEGLAGADPNQTGRIGLTRRESAARAKQDIYQAVAAATDQLLFSCSAARPGGRALAASQVFRDAEALLKTHCPQNLRGGLTKDELLPFAPAFALERLAVMLRQARDQQESFLTATDAESARWREALAALWRDPAWHPRMAAVLEGLHVKIAGPGIPADLATELYGPGRLSVSAIETAGTCLYWAFLAYGLRVRQRRDFVFEADSEGTFSHEVLRRFFNEAMQHPDWPALPENEVSRILDHILAEQTAPWEDGPLGKNAAGHFRGEEILRTVRTAVHAMARAIRTVPHFTPVGMEIGFGRLSSDSPLHFPAVILKLADGREITLSGKIDRVDTVQLQDGRKAVLLYDFKSGDREVHAKALDAGLQLQLPVYLMAVQQGMPDHVLAGALYQPVCEVLVDAEDEDRETIREGIEKALRARGVFLDDPEIQAAGAPLKLPSRQTTSDIISVLSPDGMQALMDRGAKGACAVVSRMLGGETAPNPLQEGMRSPCEFCGNSAACPLDSRLPGGKVRKLDQTREEDASDADL